MTRDLVGIRHGKRALNWPAIVLLGVVVGIVSGASATAAWMALTSEFDLMMLVLPVFLAIGFFLGSAIRKCWLLPTKELPVFD